MKAFIALLLAANILIFIGYTAFSSSGRETALPANTAGDSVPQLVLASERKTARQKVAKHDKTVTAGPLQCTEVAPLFGMLVVNQLTEWLDQQDIAYRNDSQAFEEVANYWVFISSLPSIEQARVILKQLRNAGIKDVYVIEAGPNRNAISLGLFREQVAAKNRVDELAELGIEVKMEARTKKVKGYSLKVGSAVEGAIGGFTQYLDVHYPKLKYQTISCEGLPF